MVACDNQPRVETPVPDEPTEPTEIPPTPTPFVTPTRARPTSADEIDFITIAIDVPDRTDQFERFDEFGNIIGFDADIMALIAEAAGIEYEFIVTPFVGENEDSGILARVADGTFDAALSAIVIPEAPSVEGIVYTQPYLEIGQTLVVPANEREITSYRDISAEMRVAAVGNTVGEQAARNILNLPPTQIIRADDAPDALQRVINAEARAAIVDSYDAAAYSDLHYQHLKMVGENDAITLARYGMVVAADNPALLQLLNEAIAEINTSDTLLAYVDQWLVPKQSLEASGSLIGTPPDRLLVGVAGTEGNLNPAATGFDPLNWEIKTNTMSGLMMYDATNTLVPALAAAPPQISEGGLVYDFVLREGLRFPDGQPLTAESVRNSLFRSIQTGNWVINTFLKNIDGDIYADDDAIQVLDNRTVRFVLREPTAYFVSLLATPPYFVTSAQCDPNNFVPLDGCGGIGPYTITTWQRGESMRLEANPNWPLTPPVMSKVELRFFDTSAELQSALVDDVIDIAWHGLNDADQELLTNRSDTRRWQGPGTFKSYLVFVHSVEPWDNPLVRQAAAYAIDREALANDVFNGRREPLYSPLPDGVPAHFAAEPQRDVERAIELLREAGYSEFEPVEIELWYTNDGHYTTLEGAYANAIKAQLEETGIFQVTVSGAAWNVYRGQMSSCELQTFLLGWHSETQPRYLEAMSWLNYFVSNTDIVCSNYQSATMTQLVESVRLATDTATRFDRYQDMQTLWAEEYPTLDLTQEVAVAVSADTVTNATINAMGFLLYDTLAKQP